MKYVVNAGSIVSGQYGFSLNQGEEFPNNLPDFDYKFHVEMKVLKIVEREDTPENSQSVQGETFKRNTNKSS